MVKIRLMRGGAKKRPHYRIVAIDERSRRDGRPLELLGTYDPLADPPRISLRMDRFEAWLAQGAQPSEAVRALVRRVRREPAPEPAEAGEATAG